MRRGLAIDRELGSIWLLPGFEAALAEAEAGAGEADAGLRRLLSLGPDQCIAEAYLKVNAPLTQRGGVLHRIAF